MSTSLMHLSRTIITGAAAPFILISEQAADVIQRSEVALILCGGADFRIHFGIHAIPVLLLWSYMTSMCRLTLGYILETRASFCHRRGCEMVDKIDCFR
jgi:hypothetical protein